MGSKAEISREMPQVGEMPTPKFFELKSVAGADTRKMIGIYAYDLGGALQTFVWWRNSGNQLDLNNDFDRNNAATFIARLKIGLGVDAALGPAIDLSKSSKETGEVGVTNSNTVGIYISEQFRARITFLHALLHIKSEEELRALRPEEFEQTLQKAKAVLPRPAS